MNHLLGNATAKEKLAAILNAGGALVCPRAGAENNAKQTTSSGTSPIATPTTAQISIRGIDVLREPMSIAFDAAAAMHEGSKANLSALGLELRKKVSGFSSKQYGHKLFGNLVKELGYRVEGQWAFRKKSK